MRNPQLIAAQQYANHSPEREYVSFRLDRSGNALKIKALRTVWCGVILEAARSDISSRRT